MYLFSNDREALDFVASQIAEQAQLDGVPLSEVERKMLYFSETAWTLPNILEVSDEFDRDYDQKIYEKKISQLIKKTVSNAGKRFSEVTPSTRRITSRFAVTQARFPTRRLSADQSLQSTSVFMLQSGKINSDRDGNIVL